MIKIKSKQTIYFLGLYVLIVMIVIMTFITIPIGDFQRNNPFVILTFLANGAVWFALLLGEVSRHAYSLLMMHWLFCLLFFFYAPVVQYAHNQFPWISVRSDEVLLTANFLLFCWTIALLAGSRIRISNRRISSHRANESSAFFKPWDNIEKMVPILTFLNLVILSFRLVTVGPQNLLARATSGMDLGDNSSLNLLLGHTMQAISYFAATISILSWKKNSHSVYHSLLAATNVVFLIVAYFPTGLSRYAMAAVYGGVLLTFSNRLKRGRIFMQLFLAAFLIVLPFLNAFRNTAFSDVNIFQSLQNIITNLGDVWLAGDYDAYTLLTMVIDHVQTDGLTWGYQLLGVLLFWVPRRFWPTKPVGSGHMVATAKGWSFTNLSCPLPAEMYINFGLAGIFLLGFFIGKALTKLDNKYWGSADRTGNHPRYIDPLYHCLAFFCFFVSRGDLLSSTAYVVAYIAIWIVIVMPSVSMRSQKENARKNRSFHEKSI